MPKKQQKKLLLFLASKKQIEPNGFFSTGATSLVLKLQSLRVSYVFIRMLLEQTATSETTATIIASNAPFL